MLKTRRTTRVKRLRLPLPTGRRSLIGTVFGLVLVLVATLAAAEARATSSGSPSVTITSAPPATTTSTDATIAFNASDAKKVSCKLDSGSLASCSSPVTYSGLSVGTHKFVVKAENGDKAATDKVSWEIVSGGSGGSGGGGGGLAAISVTSSIANGATLSGSVSWTATPSGSVSKVDFYMDGALKWTENAAPYVFNGDGNKLDTKTLSDGSHVLKVVATATDGTTAQVVVRDGSRWRMDPRSP